MFLQEKLSEAYQSHVFNGTGPGTAFLTTMQADEEIALLLSRQLNQPLDAAKLRTETKILTKSNTTETGLAPNKIRVFLKRVLPRWQDKFTKLLMEGFHERACAVLKTGKKSGQGTRGHIPTLQASDGLTCLKDNWFFATPNGREVLNFATKHAFTKLGCLTSVYVDATVDQAAYLRMRTVWGKPPVRGDTTPRHEPGTGREQSRNTPLGGAAWDNTLGGVSSKPQGHK